jgi:hypothetical protein
VHRNKVFLENITFNLLFISVPNVNHSLFITKPKRNFLHITWVIIIAVKLKYFAVAFPTKIGTFVEIVLHAYTQ